MKGETVEEGEKGADHTGRVSLFGCGQQMACPRSCRATREPLRNNLKWVRCTISLVTRRERHTMAKKRKVHSLTGRITLRLMTQAFKAVKRNRGAAGIDKVSVKMFDANRDENLAALMRDLKTGNFQPRPLRRVYIPKDPDSKKLRPLGIPVGRFRSLCG